MPLMAQRRLSFFRESAAFPSSLSRDDPAHVLEQNKQVHRIDRGGNEIEVPIKTSGILEMRLPAVFGAVPHTGSA